MLGFHKTKLPLILFVFSICMTFCLGCEQNRTGTPFHIPSGWSLRTGHSKMLARSYPGIQWIAIILKLQGKGEHLFTSPHSSPSSSGLSVFKMFRSRKQQAPNPLMPRKKKPKKKQPTANGFSFAYKSSHDLPLLLKLYIQSKNGVKQTYHLQHTFKKTGSKWEIKDFLYRNFQPMQSRGNNDPITPTQLLSKVEFWEQKQTEAPQHATLTLKGPFQYIEPVKKRTKTASQKKATSQKIKKPTTKMSSHHKATTKHSRTSTQKAVKP